MQINFNMTCKKLKFLLLLLAAAVFILKTFTINSGNRDRMEPFQNSISVHFCSTFPWAGETPLAREACKALTSKNSSNYESCSAHYAGTKFSEDLLQELTNFSKSKTIEQTSKTIEQTKSDFKLNWLCGLDTAVIGSEISPLAAFYAWADQVFL